MDFLQEAVSLTDTILSTRQHLHRHPELSMHEEQTRDYIEKQLTLLGIEHTRFQDCFGVMGIIRNGEGKCIAVRADMDAMPVTEETGLPFASENPGVMHACGHDVHMALALTTAKWLAENKDKWHGTVKLLFEPAEETYGGGQWMVAQGCMENPTVDCVVGQHVNPRYPSGTFYAKGGYVSGSSDELCVYVRGHSCHGAYPEGGVDAIVIACQLVTAIQTLVSRTISPFENAVVTFGEIHGGKANNVICDEVYLHGTMRTLNDKTRKLLQSEIARLVEHIPAAMGGTGELIIRPSYSAVYNDDHYYAVCEKAAADVLGEDNIVRRDAPSLGVESFCYFIDHTPGVYWDMGTGISEALHSPRHMVEDEGIVKALAVQIASVYALLAE